jgi:RNA polymerase sigma factor (sigma-70 family)
VILKKEIPEPKFEAVPSGQKTAGGSFDEDYRLFHSELVRRLNYLLGDRAAAEDVAQEAFLKLYTMPPPTRQNLVGWLYRVGARLALNYLRGEKRRQKRENQTVDSPGAEVIPLDEAMWRDERVKAVRQVLAKLPLRARLALLLRHTGFTYQEIAQVLDLSPASVGTILVRAQKLFIKEYNVSQGSETDVL